MRTKEQILELADIIGDPHFDYHFKVALLEVLIDIRTNLKDCSVAIREALNVQYETPRRRY